MGIKQMGLTVGGVASALTLPPVAARLGWRAALDRAAVELDQSPGQRQADAEAALHSSEAVHREVGMPYADGHPVSWTYTYA